LVLFRHCYFVPTCLMMSVNKSKIDFSYVDIICFLMEYGIAILDYCL
jgi:hypothetical protein